MRTMVNCLVQVLGNNELDFAEWLDYHIALGFDTVFVFDTGDRPWLESVCSRRKAHAEVVPASAAPDGSWKYKSDIISTYVSRRKSVEWCICLEDNEFLWLSPRNYTGIRDYIEGLPQDTMACTLYYKVMSSQNPTRYRVGTQIDCFTHTRREPEGFLPSYQFLPNGGVTLLRIASTSMPLSGPAIPVNMNGWYDAFGNPMSERRYNDETSSRRFSPMAYPARCYKYGIRSGIEMGFKEDAVPTGFDILDLSMQSARERFLHIPVNPETEKLFSKSEPGPNMAIVEASNGEKVMVDADEAAEMKMPITRARIDKMILKGKFFEDVCDYVATKDPNYDKGVLERMFNRERENIIKTALPYEELQNMLDANVPEAEIMKKLMITQATLDRMKIALPVLDIGGTDDTHEEGIEISVEKFNDSVAPGAMTEEEKARVDKELERRGARKKTKTTAKKKPELERVEPVVPSSDDTENKADTPTDDGTAGSTELSGSLLDNIDLDDIIKTIESHDEEIS